MLMVHASYWLGWDSALSAPGLSVMEQPLAAILLVAMAEGRNNVENGANSVVTCRISLPKAYCKIMPNSRGQRHVILSLPRRRNGGIWGLH